ncbi:hypothetical protein CJU41_21325, partial [Pseudomonas aeruginosa]
MSDFFSEFDAERWYFTFMDEDDNTLPVQQVGIVAVFHLVDAYLPVRRKGIAEAFTLYHEFYGDKLKGGIVKTRCSGLLIPDTDLGENPRRE